MVKVGKPIEGITKEERSRKLKEAGMKMIHRKSGDYVQHAKAQK
jgi:hypothetical protein